MREIEFETSQEKFEVEYLEHEGKDVNESVEYKDTDEVII